MYRKNSADGVWHRLWFRAPTGVLERTPVDEGRLLHKCEMQKFLQVRWEAHGPLALLCTWF